MQRARLDSGLEDLLRDARSGVRKLASLSAQNAEKNASREDCAVRRGMIRFLVIIIDCSENMNQRDMRPTRLAVVHQVTPIHRKGWLLRREFRCEQGEGIAAVLGREMAHIDGGAMVADISG